tara:strand:- start:283 stop:591 length:309 start_codon:yes stop_codon:yes gene_type:complete
LDEAKSSRSRQGLADQRGKPKNVLLYRRHNDSLGDWPTCQFALLCEILIIQGAVKMTKKKILLRIDPELHEVIRRMSEAEMRSVNGQIEFLLKKAIIEQRGE